MYVYRHIRLDKNEPFYVGIEAKNMKPIIQLDDNGSIINTFKSVKDCSVYFKCKDDTISRIINNPNIKTLLRLRGLNLKFK